MQTPEGKQGLVPVNYIDKLDTPPESVKKVAEKKESFESGTSSSSSVVTNNNINDKFTSPPKSPVDDVVSERPGIWLYVL